MAIDVEGAVPLLLVYDVPTAIAFYRDVLGFELIQTSVPFDDAKDNYGWAMLRKNGIELMLNNMYENNIRPAQPDVVRSGHHRDTTIYFSCRDVDGVYVYLRDKGIAVREPVNTYYGMRQVQTFDPDGYSLVFQWPVNES
jgi:uncharacterized glyoxalase superfamily protein PhnB